MRTASVTMSTEEAKTIIGAWREVSGNHGAGLGEALYGFALLAASPTELDAEEEVIDGGATDSE